MIWMNKNMELEGSSGACVDHPWLLRQDDVGMEHLSGMGPDGLENSFWGKNLGR